MTGLNTNAPYRAIGQPTGDAVEDARRAERSTWFSLRAVMDKAAEVPPDHDVACNIARMSVRIARDAWAEALRELDAAVMT